MLLESGVADEYVSNEADKMEYDREKARTAAEKYLQYSIHAFTDGSWHKSTGRTAAAFVITDPQGNTVVFKGGGHDQYEQDLNYEEGKVRYSVKMSSTRAEGEGLLRLHMALLMTGTKHDRITTGVDSQSAISIYRKLDRMTPFERINLPNRDVWELVRELKELWGSVAPYYVESHMDDLLTGTREEILQQLSAKWRGNFHADEVTEESYSNGSHITHKHLAAVTRATVWYSSEGEETPVLVPYAKWARETAQHKHMVQYISTHPLAEEGVDWGSSVSLRKAKAGIAERIRIMKMMWNLYAYGNVKLRRQHCSPTEAMCAWCGKELETREHILVGACDSTDLADRKRILYEKISQRIITDLRDDKVAHWVETTVPMLWQRGKNDTADILHARIKNEMDELEEWDPLELWRGVVP